MKNIIFAVLIITLLSCSSDPLFEIKKMAKNRTLKDTNSEADVNRKISASMEYKKAIDTMVDAYSSYYGVNKDIGKRLLNLGSFKKAAEHFEMAIAVRNNDPSLYHDLAVSYVNLYKIESKQEYLTLAKENYKIALNINDKNKTYLYDYAQLLVFGTGEYPEAIKILNDYVYKKNASNETVLNSHDINGHFLLGRAYYMNGEYDKAYRTYTEIYQFEKNLSEDQKGKLTEFLITVDNARKAGAK